MAAAVTAHTISIRKSFKCGLKYESSFFNIMENFTTGQIKRQIRKINGIIGFTVNLRKEIIL
jgi:hypothetical protein